METTLSCIGVLIALFIWRTVWRPALLNYIRDNLFEIRNRTRDAIAEKDALNDPEYLKFREIINGEIRHLDRYSLSSMHFYIRLVNENQDAVTESTAVFSSNTFVSTMIAEERSRAADQLRNYMVLSSMPWFSLVVILIPFFFVWTLVKHTKGSLASISRKIALAQFGSNLTLSLERVALSSP